MARYIPKEAALASATRQVILELVRDRPGVTLTQMARQLSCQPSTILWHTAKLDRAGLVRTAKVGPSRIYYASGAGPLLRQRGMLG